MRKILYYFIRRNGFTFEFLSKVIPRDTFRLISRISNFIPPSSILFLRFLSVKRDTSAFRRRIRAYARIIYDVRWNSNFQGRGDRRHLSSIVRAFRDIPHLRYVQRTLTYNICIPTYIGINRQPSLLHVFAEGTSNKIAYERETPITYN